MAIISKELTLIKDLVSINAHQSAILKKTRQGCISLGENTLFVQINLHAATSDYVLGMDIA
jgi:hypothetical protein